MGFVNGFTNVAHGFFYDELVNTILLWYHFVCCTFSSEIYVYLKPWILSSRNICPVPMLCAGIFIYIYIYRERERDCLMVIILG